MNINHFFVLSVADGDRIAFPFSCGRAGVFRTRLIVKSSLRAVRRRHTRSTRRARVRRRIPWPQQRRVKRTRRAAACAGRPLQAPKRRYRPPRSNDRQPRNPPPFATPLQPEPRSTPLAASRPRVPPPRCPGPRSGPPAAAAVATPACSSPDGAFCHGSRRVLLRSACFFFQEARLWPCELCGRLRSRCRPHRRRHRCVHGRRAASVDGAGRPRLLASRVVVRGERARIDFIATSNLVRDAEAPPDRPATPLRPARRPNAALRRFLQLLARRYKRDCGCSKCSRAWYGVSYAGCKYPGTSSNR